MRRKDKEITEKEEILSIIKKAKVCRLGLSFNNVPYVVPLNFGYKDNCLFFHSAKNGKKIDILKKNNFVCFELDVENEIKQAPNICDYTTRYYSIIGYGKVSLIEEINEKIEYLNIIVEHYTKKKDYCYNESIMNNLVIMKLMIEKMTGKKSSYL